MSETWKVVLKELKNEDFSSAEAFVGALKNKGFSDAEINSQLSKIQKSDLNLYEEVCTPVAGPNFVRVTKI